MSSFCQSRRGCLILNHVAPVCYQELGFRIQYIAGNLFVHLPKPAPGHLSQLESVFVDTLSFIIRGPFQGLKDSSSQNKKKQIPQTDFSIFRSIFGTVSLFCYKYGFIRSCPIWQLTATDFKPPVPFL